VQLIAPPSFVEVLKYAPDQPRDAQGQWTRLGQGPDKIGSYLYGHTTSAELKQEPLPTTVAAAENRIRNQAHEHGYLIRNGQPIKVLGNDDSHHVAMGDLTGIDFKDATFTHNHPSGFGLSNRDGVSAARFNMQEMRAVTANGTHVIRRTGTEWPPHFEEAIDEVHTNLMMELGLRLHAGEITAEYANAQHHLLLYQRLQQTVGGFTYTYEPKAS
jgi:hypothetical protein